MATAGVGVNMLVIERMQRVLDARPRFVARVFTDEERRACERKARPAEHYAARFAARGAVVKALGASGEDGIGLHDISVGDEKGRPVALLAGRAAEIAGERGVSEIALSLSFTREVAVANAVAVTEASRPKPPEREDAARALAASFREARSLIDELERVQEGESLPVLEQMELEEGAVADGVPTEE